MIFFILYMSTIIIKKVAIRVQKPKIKMSLSNSFVKKDLLTNNVVTPVPIKINNTKKTSEQLPIKLNFFF